MTDSKPTILFSEAVMNNPESKTTMPAREALAEAARVLRDTAARKAEDAKFLHQSTDGKREDLGSRLRIGIHQPIHRRRMAGSFLGALPSDATIVWGDDCQWASAHMVAMELREKLRNG